jgi:ABC-type Fe3+-hydroxamate transport system substrate-binding protein
VIVEDDMGTLVELARPPHRIVSLVPSLTEAVAATESSLLVGATDWCTHPGDLDVRRVRGTKNPDRAAVIGLQPDLVLANKEENRELDVRRLREAGVPVWVTVTESVPQALESLRRLFVQALQVDRPGWLARAVELWSHPAPPPVARIAVPIWRDPWMVVGGSTFTGDLLRQLGLVNAYADHPDRYPTVELSELDRAGLDLVVLPDEPYVFGPTDGPEAFAHTATTLTSGRLLTWYGPSLVEAHGALAQLADAARVSRAGD